MSDEAHHERERFFGAARRVAGLTVLSRLLGMSRDIAIVALGATRATDAFWTAFAIPNLLRRLFGEGALSAAFVPVFTDVAEADGWDKARLVLANTAGLLALLLGGLVVVGELAILGWLALGAARWDTALLLRLVAVMLPFMFTICLLALGSAALQCKGRFSYPAFAPVVLNIFLIAAAAAAHTLLPGQGERQLTLLALAVVIGGAVQLAGVAWLLRRTGLSAAMRLRPVLAPVRRIARLMLPMMIPLGILQFSALFDRLYAWWMTATPGEPMLELFGWSIRRPLQPGVVTCLYAATRLYMFPLGILALSLATAIFPLLSRYAARNDLDGLRGATNRALRLSIFLGVPAGVGLILLAEPIVTLIYRHGQFTDATRPAAILRMYCLAMPAYFANHILLRAYYAQQDTRTPLLVTGTLAVCNMLLVIVLIFPLGAAGIGVATAATAATTAGLLTWRLRHRWGRLGLRRIIAATVRTALATAVMAAAVIAARHGLAGPGKALAAALGPAWIASAVVVAGAIVAGAAAYLLAAVLMRCAELGELRRRAPAPVPPQDAATMDRDETENANDG
ncbi:MAG: murein biosynthesis integral membrane protein MurJ [Phycisphaerae bacterium]|nr:murein biosynthesis integral membrane protein MurJ [Phycisphaerae bacterium]